MLVSLTPSSTPVKGDRVSAAGCGCLSVLVRASGGQRHLCLRSNRRNFTARRSKGQAAISETAAIVPSRCAFCCPSCSIDLALSLSIPPPNRQAPSAGRGSSQAQQLAGNTTSCTKTMTSPQRTNLSQPECVWISRFGHVVKLSPHNLVDNVTLPRGCYEFCRRCTATLDLWLAMPRLLRLYRTSTAQNPDLRIIPLLLKHRPYGGNVSYVTNSGEYADCPVWRPHHQGSEWQST